MNRLQSLSKVLVGCSVLAASAASAQDPGVPWDAVGTILGARAVQTDATYRYAFPRTDLTVRIGDVTVEPAIALGSWAGFGVMGGDTVVMGDLVVTTGELGPVLRQLATDGIAVRASTTTWWARSRASLTSTTRAEAQHWNWPVWSHESSIERALLVPCPPRSSDR